MVNKVRKALLLFVMTLAIALTPITVSAQSASAEEPVQVETEAENTDEVTIEDEEVPLYADGSTQVSATAYLFCMVVGMSLILGGIYLFQKQKA